MYHCRYLQTSAKAFARDSGANDSTRARTSARMEVEVSVGWQRSPGPSEIDRNYLAQWQHNCGLSERNAARVDKAPVNEHTIWYALLTKLSRAV